MSKEWKANAGDQVMDFDTELSGVLLLIGPAEWPVSQFRCWLLRDDHNRGGDGSS
ncbi:hypothetical protein [Corynebacterium diphtheriae]|uniref:hypothetical protein n=1 Tax=Corynebacterium diphtheriae TaxID=1717 RepID=UPI001FD8B36B|nr:hypothetical protein [Corynebacterium diphtheriae]